MVRIPVFTLTASPSQIQVDQSSSLEEPRNLLPEIEGYEFRFVYRDTAFENISKQDASLMYSYRPLNPGEPLVWVGFEIAKTKASCHPWEACLITYAGSRRVSQVDLRDVQLSVNPPISARYFAFIEERTENIQVVLYWYTKSIFKTVAGYEDKWVKLSVIAYTSDESQVIPVEIMLLGFAEAIAEHWTPVSSWATLLISVAEKSHLFIALLSILLIITNSLRLHTWLIDKRSAQQLFAKIKDPVDTTIIDLVRNHPGSCDEELLKAYNMAAESPIDYNQLINKLSQAQALNILENRIVKIDNEPYLRWYSPV